MPKITEGQFALGGLAVFAVWVFVVLPFLYPWPEAAYGNQRPADAQEQSNSVGDESPSLIALKLFTTTGRDEITKYCARHANKEEEEWAQKYVCDIKITDVYLAVFNFLLVMVTCGLIAVGVLTIRKMRITEERQLRAYVNIAQVRVEHLMGKARFYIEIRNYGQTPAYETTTESGVKLAKFPLVEELPLRAEPPAGKVIIGPGTPIHNMLPAQRQLTEAEIQQLRDGSMAIYVFGRIKYRDAFKRRRETLFRFLIGGEAGVRDDGICGACAEGNESD